MTPHQKFYEVQSRDLKLLCKSDPLHERERRGGDLSQIRLPRLNAHVLNALHRIFEMTYRNLPAFLNTSLVILSPLVTALTWFWWSPLHLVFTYLIPIAPLFFAWDGYISCIRTRTEEEIKKLIQKEEASGLDCHDWTFHIGQTKVLPPFGNLYWFIGTKNRKSDV